MQSTTGLRSLLLTTLGAPNHAQSTEQELYEELMSHKHVLLNLFDVGRRSPEQQRAVESGKLRRLDTSIPMFIRFCISQARSPSEARPWL